MSIIAVFSIRVFRALRRRVQMLLINPPVIRNHLARRFSSREKLAEIWEPSFGLSHRNVAPQPRRVVSRFEWHHMQQSPLL